MKLLRKVVAANPKDANAWNYIGYSHRVQRKKKGNP